MENSKNLNADQAGISSEIVENIDNITSTLSQEQKLWLSQYLVGNNAFANIESTNNDQILTILYGSQTGNSRSIAEELNDAAKEEGIQTELISMGKFKDKDGYANSRQAYQNYLNSLDRLKTGYQRFSGAKVGTGMMSPRSAGRIGAVGAATTFEDTLGDWNSRMRKFAVQRYYASLGKK